MSTYSTASENSASDASPAPLPIPPPSIYATTPPGWGGPKDAPLDGIPPPLTPGPLSSLSTPLSPPSVRLSPLLRFPLPSCYPHLLLPAPPPTRTSPSPAPSPIPDYVEALANQILEAMEDGSDKENILPRPVTPYPDTPHVLQSEFVLVYDRLGLIPNLRVKVHRVLGILLNPKAASRVLYEVISRESAVLMDLLGVFHNIAYTPPMGEEVSRYWINLMVDLALCLLQNGVELVLYESLRKIDWNQDHCFEYVPKDQDRAHLARPFLSSAEYRPAVLHRAAEELRECLGSQSAVLQRCSELQVRLERETRALTAILPLTFNETPTLEWSEECYLDDAVQHLGHLASPSSLLPDAPITTTPELTYPTFPGPPIPPITPEIQRKRDQRRCRRNQTAKKPTPPSPSPGPSRQVARRTQGRPERYQGRGRAPSHHYRHRDHLDIHPDERPHPFDGFYEADNYVEGYDNLVDYD
ncbi:hypothetical protein M378DRAFT_17810 [Amanita muscaria Koide BX008]|uniref:Uncharacterized protein n=1 Tax=Amanita muscaria (strain Koide BX008) TaxID=946122 RepID=A0A0C2WG52_AMAMK|nr:hypothetical protein M378DRAFT_17810 [Amanita muscaria Koide BX008]